MSVLHPRDGSLLRKKQEQWAREKEEQQKAWFPFGSPGGGAPNPPKKKTPETPEGREEATKREESRSSSTENIVPGSSNQDQVKATQSSPLQQTRPCPAAAMLSHSQEERRLENGAVPMQPLLYAPYAQPIPMDYAQILQYQQQQQQHGQYRPVGPYYQAPGMYPQFMPAPYYQPFIPQMPDRNVVHQAEPTYAEPWVNQVPPWSERMPTGDASTSSSSAASSRQNLAVVHPMLTAVPPVPLPPHFADTHKPDSSNVTTIEIGLRPNTTDTRSYDEQIAEKRRLEDEEVARERIEEDRRRRSLEDERRAREEQEDSEERRKRATQEEVARREAALAESIERARKEAEAMKKARVYKHVLEAAEDPSRILGVESEVESEKIFQQLNALERQKRLDREALQHAPRPKTAKEEPKKLTRTRSESTNSREPQTRIEIEYRSGGREERRPRAATLEPEDPRSSEEPRPVPTFSVDDRPIRPAACVLDGSYDQWREASTSAASTPLSRNSKARTSLRVPRVTPKTADNRRRSDSAERRREPVDRPQTMPSERASRAPTRERAPPPPPVPKEEDVPSTLISNVARVVARRQTYAANPLQFINNLPTEQDIVPKPKPRRSAPTEAVNPLFEPVATRNRRMRVATAPHVDEHLKDGIEVSEREKSLTGSAGSKSLNGRGTSVDSNEDSLSTSSLSPNSNSNSMSIPSINLPEDEVKPKADRLNETLLTAKALLRSNPATPAPSCSSPFTRKLSQIGGARALQNEDPLSPEIRQRDELMRSTERLRGSMASLCATDGRESGRNTPVPGVERFHARSSQYRSFNARRASEKQEQILESLAKLREQLRTRQNARSSLGSCEAGLGRSVSRSIGNGLARSPTAPCMPSSPLTTPGKV